MLQDVCKKVSKKLKSSADLSKQDLFLCMEILRHDSVCKTSEDSSLWMNIINQGGLNHIMDMCFFYAMEEEVRRFIHNRSHKQSALDVKQLSNAILSSEDVLFFWSTATVQFDENEKRLLLKKIFKSCGSQRICLYKGMD